MDHWQVIKQPDGRYRAEHVTPTSERLQATATSPEMAVLKLHWLYQAWCDGR